MTFHFGYLSRDFTKDRQTHSGGLNLGENCPQIAAETWAINCLRHSHGHLDRRLHHLENMLKFYKYTQLIFKLYVNVTF